MDYLPNDPILIIIALVFIFIALFVLAIIFINTYTFFGKWLKFLEKERNRDSKAIEQKAYAKADAILEDAKKSSLKIIEDSTKKAQLTLTGASQINDASKKDIQGAFEKLSKGHITALEQLSKELKGYYVELLKEHKDHNTSALQNSSKEIENALLQEVDEFKTTLHDETVGMQHQIDEKITTAYTEVTRELEEYKNSRINDIESNIYSVLTDVIKQTIGKTISLEDHQEYILHTIEKAKKKGDLNVTDNS